MNVFELISHTLGNETTTAASFPKRYAPPQLKITIHWENGRFKSRIHQIDKRRHECATWKVMLWKNMEYSKNMKRIGKDWTVIETCPSSSKTNIFSTDPISTTSELITHFQRIYRKVNFSLRFENVDMGEHGLYKWKFLAQARMIALVDSNIYPFHIQEFQSMLRPHQELYIDSGSVELENAPKVRKITIKTSQYFIPNKFKNYKCEHLEVLKYSMNYNDPVDFINNWLAGEHKSLKTFTLHDVDEKWVTVLLKLDECDEGPKCYKRGSKIIEFNSSRIVFSNGRMATVNFTDTGVLIFVVCD